MNLRAVSFATEMSRQQVLVAWPEDMAAFDIAGITVSFPSVYEAVQRAVARAREAESPVVMGHPNLRLALASSESLSDAASSFR